MLGAKIVLTEEMHLQNIELLKNGADETSSFFESPYLMQKLLDSLEIKEEENITIKEKFTYYCSKLMEI
jgi:hypothetical protein